MPLYPYSCKKCGIEIEKFRKIDQRDEPVFCSICEKLMDRILVTSGAAHTWKVDVWEHIDVHPMVIHSKRQLKEECKKRGVIATGYM